MSGAIANADITGLILAGGRGSRMGGVDKGLQPWRGLPLAQQVLLRLKPQVGPVLLNANRNLDTYRAWGLPVLADGPPPGRSMVGVSPSQPPPHRGGGEITPSPLVGRVGVGMASGLGATAPLDFSGPLAGFLAGLDACTTPYLLTAPCDSPLLPLDLAARLGAGLLAAQARIALPRAGGRLQPVFCLMETSLRDDLRAFLQSGGSKIDLWTARHPTAIVEFTDSQAFENINTRDDLQRLDTSLSP